MTILEMLRTKLDYYNDSASQSAIVVCIVRTPWEPADPFFERNSTWDGVVYGYTRHLWDAIETNKVKRGIL